MIMGRQSGLGRGLGALIPPKPSNTAPVTGASQPVSAPSVRGPASDIRPPSDVGAANEVRRPMVDKDVAPPDRLAAALEKLPPDSPSVSESQSLDPARLIHELSLEAIDPNPHQPRRHFDHAQLEDLITSIKEHGVLQPIVVTQKSHGRYELIAGERRLRASKIAGKTTIPALVRSATEQQKLELAIIENIQRQQLNALEEADSYLRLQDEFNLTQDEVAQKVGKSRSQVANIIRLLQLPEDIKEALATGKITVSNARTLLSLEGAEQMKLFQDMLSGNFTARQAEARIPHKRGPRRPSLFDPNVAAAETKLRGALGAKVAIKRDPRGEGEIRIAFLNDEDFNGLVQKLAGDYGLGL